MRNVFSKGGLVLSAGVAAVLAGCSGSGSTPGTLTPAPTVPATRAYLGTQSPGDVWTWNLTSSGTFTGANETRSFTYDGTTSDLASGFKKLTVAATSDSSVRVGAVTYAFEVPGVGLIVRGMDAGGTPIVGSLVGERPTGTDLRYNWITMPKRDWNPLRDNAYGTALISISGDAGNLTIDSFGMDGTPLSTGERAAMTFSGGRMVLPGGGAGVATPAGVFIVDSGPDAGGLVGMRTAAANIDTADLTRAGREYRGMLFNNPIREPGVVYEGVERRGQLVGARSDGAGGLLGFSYRDVENNVEEADAEMNVSLRFTSQPSPGLFQGTLSPVSGDPAEAAQFVFAVNRIDGKYVIFGFSGEREGNNNFLLIEK